MSPHPQAKIWFAPSQLGRLGEASYKELVPVTGPPEKDVPFAPPHVKIEADQLCIWTSQW